MKMSLEQWNIEVSKHLDLIEAGADIILRHTEQLPLRPDFETLAEDHLKRAEAALDAALDKIHLAQAIYHNKKVEE